MPLENLEKHPGITEPLRCRKAVGYPLGYRVDFSIEQQNVATSAAEWMWEGAIS
jgi:hypothetical protein